MYVNTIMQTNPCAFLTLLGYKLSYLILLKSQNWWDVT